MNVVVKLFAAARELAGQSQIGLELPAGADVSTVRQALIKRAPQLAPLAARSMIALNAEYVPDAASIVDGDELALIPPVSGG
jgi:molybdopterin converting factor subunit 1